MKGDFSRLTFNPKKHYSGVRMQQGRVQLDADWNEHHDIIEYRSETGARSIIGDCGVPKPVGGFQVGTTPDQREITVSPGRIYVDGILCELEQAPEWEIDLEASSGKQVRLIESYRNRNILSPGLWVTLAGENKEPLIRKIERVGNQVVYLTEPIDGLEEARQPKLRPIATFLPITEATVHSSSGFFVIYLEAWKQHITALEDPSIREKALEGADTTTRVKIAWKIKSTMVPAIPSGPLPTSLTPPGCDATDQLWKAIAAPSTGLLRACISSPALPDSPCGEGGAGVEGLGNQLYRVEVHDGGKLGEATFKWSRENGSVVTRIIELTNSTAKVADLGRDQESLGIKSGQWVEVTDDLYEIDNIPGQMSQVNVDTANKEITFNIDADKIVVAENAKIRRWDSAGAIRLEVPDERDGWIQLEKGIEIQFAEGTYHTGDYWLISSRSTGEIEWPVMEGGDNAPLFVRPHGGGRHFAKLAIAEAKHNTWNIAYDCRKQFPNLTQISAEDIKFDNDSCQLPGATTVQDALDILCATHLGSCTLVPTPGKNWEKILENIQPNQSVNICFRPGIYPLDKTVVLKDIKSLSLSGVGGGTQLVALQDETALMFQNCGTVTVRDLAAQSKVVGAAERTKHLKGTLTFVACEHITVERVSLSCASGDEKGATCITVINSYESVPYEVGGVQNIYVRISHCELGIGSRQTGVLLVNVERAQVEDNILRSQRETQIPSLNMIKDQKGLLRAARRSIVSNALIGDQLDENAITNESVTYAGQTVRFKTPSFLQGIWQSIIDRFPPADVVQRSTMLNYIYSTAEKMIVDREFRKSISVSDASIANMVTDPLSVGLQGIVVAGIKMGETRIVNNTIINVLQGIHIGVNRPSTANYTAQTGFIAISGNRIDINLQPGETRARHGIFVGDSDMLIIENNYLKVNRLTGTNRVPVDGLRIWGTLGRLVIVKQNHLVDFPTGIYFRPLNEITTTKNQWIIEDNMASHASTPVDVILPDTVEREEVVRVRANIS